MKVGNTVEEFLNFLLFSVMGISKFSITSFSILSTSQLSINLFFHNLIIHQFIYLINIQIALAC